MRHRHHLICVAAALGLAGWLLLAGSGGSAVAGVSLALLLCPLVMGAVMWLLMRQPRTQAPDRLAERPDLRAGQR